MPTFESEGLTIAYEQFGAGKPILLVHGFASNGRINWVNTGWVETLVEAGYAPIVIDNRGHGLSEKSYQAEHYPAPEMAKDARNLILHLGLGPIPVMGYSMGARICTFLAKNNPELVSAVILGGLGENMFKGMRNADVIVEALLAPSLADVSDKTGRLFRRFAEHTQSDLKALATCMSSTRVPISHEDVRAVQSPVLVAIGTLDDVGGAGQPLADEFAHGSLLEIPNRDHMTATGDKVFKHGVLEFLAQLPN